MSSVDHSCLEALMKALAGRMLSFREFAFLDSLALTLVASSKKAKVEGQCCAAPILKIYIFNI